MTGRRRRAGRSRRLPTMRAALTWRRVLVLALLATLTMATWTASAHAAPTPAPTPAVTAPPGGGVPATGSATSTSGSSNGDTTGGGAGGSAAGAGASKLSPADQAMFDEMKRLAQDTTQQMAESSQQQMTDQATEELRKELPDEGGVLGVFNTTDQYGIPLSVYTINPDTGGWSDWQLKVYGFLIEICFMGTKWMVAFACWLITWALGFGLAKILLKPVLAIAASLHTQVIVELGLPSLCLTVAGTVCAWHILLGDRSKGFGELALTLVISALTTTALISPPTQLMGGADGGMLGAAQGFSLEVASVIIDSGHAPGTTTPVTGTDSLALTRPITDALVDALVVKPAELLEYGRTFDGDCAKQYAQAKISQLAYDRKTDSVIQLLQDNDSPGDIPGIGPIVSTVTDPTGITDYGVDKVISIAGGWVKDHYGKPPMSKFEDKCIDGDAGAAKKASVDKLAGALFVLLAALIVAVFICRLAGGFLTAQCRVALEAIRGEVVLVAGTLPGGGRTVLWEWCATLLRVFQQLIMSVLLLAVFLVVITTLLDPSLDDQFGNSLALRFLVLDIVCIGAFVYRKRVAVAARRSSMNFRRRFEGARIGGAGNAIFRAGQPRKENTERRTGVARTAVMLGALALSGGTSTTMLGGGRSLARRIAPGGRPGGPRPRPAGWQQEPGRNQRPASPGGPPVRPGNGSRGSGLPSAPTAPPPRPTVPPRPAVAPRARRVAAPRTMPTAANSARQQALRRRLNHGTTPYTATAPRRRPQPRRSGGAP